MYSKFLFLSISSFLVFVPSAFSQEVVRPDIGAEDLYYYNHVKFDEVVSPEDTTVLSGESLVTLEGSGSVTVINKKIDSTGSLRVTVFGGTEIRNYRERVQDSVNYSWWDGLLTAPVVVQQPQLSDIQFTGVAASLDSRKLVYAAYGMGKSNEEYRFSQPAMFVFPVVKPEGTKIWIAQRGVGESQWNVGENDYCFIEDGMCIVALSNVSELALIEQLYSRCPQTHVGVVQNGEFVGPPTCAIQCYNGYSFDATLESCVRASRTSGSSYEVRPGTFRFVDARGQLDRHFDLDLAATGDKEHDDRLRIQNASSQKTVREQMERDTDREDSFRAEMNGSDDGSDNDGFMNYLLQIRNSFEPNNNVFSATTSIEGNNENENIDGAATNGDDAYHASAPLLPSTGAGVFLTLIILGMVIMVFARRRHM